MPSGTRSRHRGDHPPEHRRPATTTSSAASRRGAPPRAEAAQRAAHPGRRRSHAACRRRGRTCDDLQHRGGGGHISSPRSASRLGGGGEEPDALESGRWCPRQSPGAHDPGGGTGGHPGSGAAAEPPLTQTVPVMSGVTRACGSTLLWATIYLTHRRIQPCSESRGGVGGWFRTEADTTVVSPSRSQVRPKAESPSSSLPRAARPPHQAAPACVRDAMADCSSRP